METRRSAQLKDIIALSQQMLESARALQWDSVAELEGRRKELVMQCFRCPTSEQDAPAVAACIREILSLNQEITLLGGDCRGRLAAEIHTQQIGRAVSAAYLSCSG